MYRVIIADDEPYIVEGIKHIINWEEYGIEIAGTASNGVEALELLLREKAELLITDIKMPKMNGLELIHKAKELNLRTRFIILSGYDDFEYLKESIKLGIENYILKPVNSQEFEETIVNVLSKIHSSNCQTPYQKKDISIIRDNILFRWVTGSISRNELEERAALLDIKLEWSQYTVSVLRILPSKDKAISLHLQKVVEVCCESMNSLNPGIVFCTPNNEIAFITNESTDCTSLGKLSLNNLRKTMDLNFFFTIGSTEDDYSLVERSFERAMELQQYSIIMPCNSILNYNNFKQNISGNQMLEKISYDEISRCILAKDLEALFLCIDNIFNVLISTNGLTPSVVKNIAAELLFCVVNNFRIIARTKSNPIIELDYPFSDIFKMDSINEMCKFIKATAKHFLNLANEKNESINPLIRRILDRMEANYYDDICLKTLAIELNTNANYLGQLFKEETGEYFSDYLNRIRINKAKELLRNTDRNTKDISIDTGYKDVNYFYKAFKKFTGISPSEYRSNREKNNKIL